MIGAELFHDQLEQLAGAVQLPLEQVAQVYELLAKDGAITPTVILSELNWFYRELGLDRHYFEATPPPVIARHVQSLYAGKILSRSSGEDVDLRLDAERQELAMYTCRDDHEIAVGVERQLEERYEGYRLQSYRTRGTTSPESSSHLRLYFLTRPDFDEPEPEEHETRIEQIGSRSFLDRAGEQTKRRYQELIERAASPLGATIDLLDRPDKGARQILIAMHRGTTHSYLSSISEVLHSHGIRTIRKYIEPFANGIVIYSIYVDEHVPREELEILREELSLTYVLPRSALTPLLRQGALSAQEVVYAYAGWKFAHQFLSRYREEHATLAAALADDPRRLGLLEQIRHRLTKDTFTEDRIYEVIVRYPELIKELYADFAAHHFVGPDRPVKPYDVGPRPELQSRLNKAVSSQLDQAVLSTFLTFNRHVLSTNFYKDTKVALAFRLDPALLPEGDYSDRPHGIYYFVSGEFRGFHVRFRDVARGGVRIIRSPDGQAFKSNADRLFKECYQLAHTQHKKNKDIPEGGSKGAILLSLEHQDRAETAFKKYVDAMLDLLLPNEEIFDHLGRQEILYLGPDEGTAELMDWASWHARGRGYPFWKAFTTGKSVEQGGIPHDLYGMTTRSVHQYVLGSLLKLGLDEGTITKLQTGGPDGDLGSNEITISKDRTVGVIDGSGVLHDPEGLDREELTRLAEARLMVDQFDRARLGPSGFVVSVDDRDVALPDGSVVESGYAFRNAFHLDPRAGADLFVPCGGRPDSVHINNVEHLFDVAGKPRFRLIVEGANLFFTQAARLALEQAGVVVYKDASANKGGVTSSSLEVLAALALDDDQLAEHLLVRCGRRPDFYVRYIEEVHARIERNARLEFELIWREHERTGTPRSVLTDQLSDKINTINDEVQGSSLWDNDQVRRGVLGQACPATLIELVGLETILERVPQNYLRAIQGAYLASRFVYRHGMSSGEVAFFEFLQPYLT